MGIWLASFSGAETLTIETVDGSEFDLQSFFVRIYSFNGAGTFNLEGFKNAGSVGSQSIAVCGSTTNREENYITPNTTFDDVDRVVLSSTGVGFFDIFDDFVFGTAVTPFSGRTGTLNTATDFNASTTSWARSERLSDDKILTIYKDGIDSETSPLRAVVGTVSGTSISYGTSVIVSSEGILNAPGHIAVLSPSKAVIVWERNDATDNARYEILDISGNTITTNTEAALGLGEDVAWINSIRVTALSEDLVVAIYEANLATDAIKYVAGTVSGSTITWGTTLTGETNVSNTDIVRMTDDKFAVVYEYNGGVNTADGRIVAGTVSGNTITLGTVQSFQSGNAENVSRVGIVSLSETEAAVLYEDDVPAVDPAKILYATLSGTTWTFPGTATTFSTTQAVSQLEIDALSSTEVIVVLNSGSTNNSVFVTGLLSGNDFTMSGETIYLSQEADIPTVSALTSDLAVLTYVDDRGANGTADYAEAVEVSLAAGTNPEINVQGNSTNIVMGDTSPTATDHTDFGTGANLSRTFTIQNLGTGTLTLGSNAVTITGTNAGDFSVNTQPATTVSGGSSTTFIIDFSSAVASTRSAEININSDDIHEPNYFFSVQAIGAAVAIPLTITGLTGVDKVYDDTTTGSATGTAALSGVVGGDVVTISGSPVFTFASANVGTGITLNTTGYTLSGADAGKYTLTQPTLSADITAKTLTITGLTGVDKVYDDTTFGSATGTAAPSGIEAGDDVSLGGSPVFTFASANVGTGITLNTSGYTISGTDSGNYTLTQPTLSADITAKTLTITGITGVDKPYDGITLGSATGTAAPSGLESGDDVSLGGSPVFTFASASVGTGITLNTSGYTISGTDSGNYSLTQPTLSADITAKTITITGLTAQNKPYDGTTAATATGTATMSGVIGADDVSLGGSPVFTFASANVGTGIRVNTTGYTISGTESGNYSLTQPTLSANITGISLTITGLTGVDKVYDDTTTGSATGTATLNGVIGGDDVFLGGSPVFTFASANVGTGITVNTTGYTLSGTDAGKYTLTQPTLSADITAKSLTITGLTGVDKPYDGITAGSATGTAVLSGLEAGDDVFLGGSPVFAFASANVGTGITISTSGYTISGTDSGNYTLTQPTLSADITAKTITITGLTAQNKPYDGTTTATATGTATMSGVIGADDVSLGGSPVFTFASANVSTGITVNTTGYTISGTESGNYSLTQPTLSADITGISLTITGLTGLDKTYDDTTTGSATGTATLNGVIGGDDVFLGGSPVFTFASANVGTGITLNTSGYTISGTDSGNYTLTQPTLSADITAKSLTITGLTGDNKVYDGTTAGSASGTANLSGVIVADDVSLGGSPVFAFASANVGTGITISTSGYTISGTDSGNYTLTQPTLSADITGATLTITGLTGVDKIYDDTTAGTATGTATLSGVIGADDVSLGGSPVFTFASANVGTGITLNTTGYTISGTESGNYTLTQPTLSADITAKELTNTGITGDDKVYDGTTAGSASGTANLSGVVGGDDVSLGGSPVFTFASANVGTGITLNTSGYTISGTDSGNYTLTQPTLSADITAAGLTVTGLTGNDKIFDGTTAATVSGTPVLSGIIGADDVSLGGTPVYTFASPNVGTGITINTSGFTISGTESRNYTLTQPTLSADITAPIVSLATTNSNGLESVSSAVIPVTLSTVFTLTVNVDYTVTGTATEGTDYTLANGTISFSPGSTSEDITIANIIGDMIVELDETVIITLSNPTNSVLGANTVHTYTITNDDSASLSIDDVTKMENADGGATTDFTFTVTLTGDVDTGFTVGSATSNGTATASSDYTTGIGVLAFGGTNGETLTHTITVNNDAIVEADETFNVVLSNIQASGRNVVFTDATGVGTINNDDSAAVTIDDVTGNEDDGSITITATLDNGVQGGFTVDVGSTDDTATTADLDYTAVTAQTLTFSGNSGETQTFTITPTADTKLEADERLFLGISNLQATTLSVAINDGAAVIIINDDNASVTISDTGGKEDNGSINLVATLDNAVQGGFTVDVSSLDGTALLSDNDYTALSSQTLTFSGTAGETKVFSVDPTPDTILELNEMVTVSQSNLSATTLPVDITDGAVVTIVNDDSASISIDDVTRMENADGGATTDFTFTVTLTNDVDTGFTVDYATFDGSAVAGDDYTATTGQIAFAGTLGETQTFTVTVNNDAMVETDETFTVQISNVQANGRTIMIMDNSGTGTITNDDSTVITLADTTGDEDDGTITVVATLSNAVQGGFILNASTADGTAVTVSDYTSLT